MTPSSLSVESKTPESCKRKRIVCIHDKRIECGGSGLCEHRVRRNTCKDCGGSGLCEHRVRRNTCKDCGGSGLCEHGRRRSQSKLCSHCEHLIRIMNCADCYVVKVDKIVENVVNFADYGSTKDTKLLKKC